MQFLKAALCLFMGLVAFVNAVPISEDSLQPINVANPGLNMSGSTPTPPNTFTFLLDH
jgi:hypothetical protein